jgi:hypothetical protein
LRCDILDIVKSVDTEGPEINAFPRSKLPETLINPDSINISPKLGEELNEDALKRVVSADPRPIGKKYFAKLVEQAAVENVSTITEGLTPVPPNGILNPAFVMELEPVEAEIQFELKEENELIGRACKLLIGVS